MSPDALKTRIVEEFNSIGLLEFLDVETSTFRELPRFFEASHLCMQLVLGDASALAATSSLASKMKRELEQQGIELEYEIRVQWKVVSIDCGALAHVGDPLSTASTEIGALLESGIATRSVSINVTPVARIRILHFAAQLPAAARPDAIRKLLQAWISGQLSTGAKECWDPVLYPTRNMDEVEIAQLCTDAEGVAQPEMSSRA